jgi:hypothetical protein
MRAALIEMMSDHPLVRETRRTVLRMLAGQIVGSIIVILIAFTFLSTRTPERTGRPIIEIEAVAWAEPATWNPVARQGETFVRVITWKDSTGALVNLTGYTAKLQLRDTQTSSVVDEFTESTGLALGGAAGTITWTVTATETALLPVGSLAYDLRLTSGAGVVTYPVAGFVNVKKRITQ